MEQQEHQRNNNLIDRVNRLIVKHSLAVPRLVSSRFISYQFWATIFTKLFHIRCDLSVRTNRERIEMIRSCLNTIESLSGISLNHIKPIRLLNYDMDTISNMLEIIETWSEHMNDNFENFVDDSEWIDGQSSSNNNSPTNLNIQSYQSEPIINRRIYQTTNDSKANNLADTLYKALKNRIIALEIEKKIKSYLGDVNSISRKQRNNDDKLIRASRQSIVRTRTIQPMATFDFNFTREEKQSPILSVDLERCYPEISIEMLKKIQHLEQNLLILERNIKPGHLNRARMNQVLSYVSEKQRRRFEMMNNLVDDDDDDNGGGGGVKKRFLMTQMISRNGLRSQRASLSEEIRKFSRSSMAAYLNARSYLERILVEEFRKVDANQRDNLNEIRRYLRDNPDNMELDKVRTMFEMIENLL
uniref:Uncharacterized protein LOC113795107 n=1 Tax=Dermatophagoides pteronyssinus TaxID=6956 RepID=A0A6P6Y7V9_DERPT|nr:uncharacterized protein LOC113795107 [Dermatophagoides pteronyssinus]